MSRSPLVTYTNWSPNYTKMTNKVNKYVIIHVIVGQWTSKQAADHFAQARVKASAHYCVGRAGDISQGVKEEHRAWTTGGRLKVNGITGAMIDRQAVTIEVASDTSHPYAITNAAFEAVIKLVADICKRNNIEKVLWRADKTLVGKPHLQNLAAHRWFANKACPGDYVYGRLGEIAEKANAILGIEEKWEETEFSVLGKVTASSLRVREKPGTVYDIVTSLPCGTVINITAKTDNGWYKMDKGYVSADWVAIIEREDDDDMAMTQEQFNKFMDAWIEERSKEEPCEWSKDARKYCEKAGIITGNEHGEMMYHKTITREEAIVLIHRAIMHVIKVIKEALSK